MTRRRALGLKTGMAARRCAPRCIRTSRWRDADEAADLRLLEAVADWCDRYTHTPASPGSISPDGVILDITGCAHLFGGEAALARDLVRRLAARGLQARARDQPIRSDARGPWHDFPQIPPPTEGGQAKPAGGDHSFWATSVNVLSPLPLAGGCVFPPSIVSSLAQVGLKRVADVLDRPRAAARGTLRHGFSSAASIRRSAREDEPITPRLPLPVALCRAALSPNRSRARERCARHDRKVGATAFRRAGAARRRRAAACRPRCSAPTDRCSASRPAPANRCAKQNVSARLFAERLAAIGEECDPGFGFDMIRLAALVTERRDPQQTGFGVRGPRGGTRAPDRTGSARAFGLRRVTRQMPQDTHIPEFAVTAVAAHMTRSPVFPGRSAAPFHAAPHPGQVDDSPAPSRPIRLFCHVRKPVEAVAESAGRTAGAFFRWRHVLHEVAPPPKVRNASRQNGGAMRTMT